MKLTTTRGLLASIALLLAATASHAQSVVFDAFPIGGSGYYPILNNPVATRFTTNSTGNPALAPALFSVTAQMENYNNSTTWTPLVRIIGTTAGNPDLSNVIGTLSSDSGATFSPAFGANNYSFTSGGGISLEENTIYWVVFSGTVNTGDFGPTVGLGFVRSDNTTGDWHTPSDFVVAQNSSLGTQEPGGIILSITGGTVAIPEPSSAAALAGLGVLGLVALRRRRSA